MAVIIAVAVITFGFMLLAYILQSTETTDDHEDLYAPGKNAEVPADHRVPEANGTIAGRVLSATGGTAVEGAHIVAELHDWDLEEEPPVKRTQWETVTDADGRFEINNLPRGRPDRWDAQYVVVASKGNFAACARRPLSGDIEYVFAWLELKQTEAIAGRVIDEQGVPIENAWVFPDTRKGHRYAFGGDHFVSQHAATAQGARTGPDGRFEMPLLEKRIWNLTVWTKDHAMAISDDIPTGTSDVELMVEKGSSLSGQVISHDDDAPVQGVKVDIRCGEHWRNARTLTTDPDGRFAAVGLPEGSCVVVVDDPNWVETSPVEPVGLARGQERTGLQIAVTKGAAVAGHVYDVTTGEPLAGVHIQARRQNPVLPARQVISDTAGNYQLTGLGAGTYTINRRWKPGYLHGETREARELTLKSGDAISGIDFPMRYGLIVQGRVVDVAGNPIERVRVESEEITGRREGEITDTYEDGRLEHRGFSPNCRVQITAKHNRYGTQFVGPLEIGQADLTDIKIVMKSNESSGEPGGESAITDALRENPPRTFIKDNLELVKIEPAPSAQVDSQTTLRATLRYTIKDDEPEPGQYFAMIVFDSTTPGQTIKVGDARDAGEVELEQTSGELKITYPLSLVIGKDDIAMPLRFRFYLNQRSSPYESRVIARTQDVSYTANGNPQESMNEAPSSAVEGADYERPPNQDNNDKLMYAYGVSLGRYLRVLLRNGLSLDPQIYLPALREGLDGRDSVLSKNDRRDLLATLIMKGIVNAETQVDMADGAITVTPERVEPVNRIVLQIVNKGQEAHRLAVVSTKRLPDALPVENRHVRVITYEGEPRIEYYHPFGSASARSGRAPEVEDDPELRKFLEDECKGHQTPGLPLRPDETGTFGLHQMDQLFEDGKSFVLFCDEPGHYEGGEYAVLFVDNTPDAPEIPYAKDRWSAAYADNPLPELETENQKLSYLSGHLTGARWSDVGVEFDAHQFVRGINDALTWSALAMADEEISAVLRRAGEFWRNGEKKRRQALPTYTCLSHPQVALKRSGHCPVCGETLHQRGEQGDTAPHPAYACPMHPEVTSPTPGPCTLCGMKLVKTKGSAAYTCSMHPEVISATPGQCEICKMQLIKRK